MNKKKMNMKDSNSLDNCAAISRAASCSIWEGCLAVTICIFGPSARASSKGTPNRVTVNAAIAKKVSKRNPVGLSGSNLEWFKTCFPIEFEFERSQQLMWPWRTIMLFFMARPAVHRLLLRLGVSDAI